MVLTQNVKYYYKQGAVLSFPDINLKRGEHALLLGNSGSGKTTLLHLLAGIRKVSFGEVIIHDTNINKLKGSELDRFRGNEIGLIFQRPHLIDSLSVLDNLKLPSFFTGIRNYNDPEDLLAEVGLDNIKHYKPYQLSTGQAQRVVIARAFCNEPAIILADEPTSSLDDGSCDVVSRLLLEQANKHNSTMIVATHDHRLKSIFHNQLTLNSK